MLASKADTPQSPRRDQYELGTHRRKLEASQGQGCRAVGKLTDDDLDVVAGRREQLSGKIQERYGVVKEEAEKQVNAWERSATDDWFR